MRHSIDASATWNARRARGERCASAAKGSTWRRLAAAALLTVAAAASVCAREAAPLVDDPALEARVMAVAEELRCLVCQNETIAASHADLAVDLRRQIRTQLTQGRSESQIKDYMVQRYGDFVLYRPRWQANTLLLWLGPFVLLFAALAVLAANVRRRRTSVTSTPDDKWSPADAERARRLLASAGAAGDARSQAHAGPPSTPATSTDGGAAVAARTRARS